MPPVNNFEAAGKATQGLSEYTVYIRWFFTGFVLSFLAIIISGLLLTQLPIFKVYSMKGDSKIRFLTYFVNITAVGDEVIIGIGGFITVLVFSGFLGGAKIPLLLANNYGLQLAHFESLCIFSSFILLITAFSLNTVYKAFKCFRNDNSNPPGYDEQINELAARDEDDNDA